ncbi:MULTISPECIES: hypothetical protein [unclassified Pannonibacter]|uniref:hypothetical protein n=1 Tax=unclassified Pannonibacter TaxID=2627228 RepID=UPI00164801DE|nr:MULTISPECIES: hypothetical protein [unclassified Pannonibacter]
MGFLRDRIETAKAKKADKVMTEEDLAEISNAVAEMWSAERRIARLRERVEVLAGNGYVSRIELALNDFCEVSLSRESAVKARESLEAINRELREQGLMNVAVHEAVENNMASGLFGSDIYEFRKIQGE